MDQSYFIPTSWVRRRSRTLNRLGSGHGDGCTLTALRQLIQFFIFTRLGPVFR